MKKILWVMAILLTLLVFLICRQWMVCHRAANQPKASVPAAVQEGLFLGSLMIQ